MKTNSFANSATFPDSHLPTHKGLGSGMVSSRGELTIPDALAAIARVGKVYLAGEHIRVQLPQTQLRKEIENELEFVKRNRQEAIAHLRRSELPASNTEATNHGNTEAVQSQALSKPFPVFRAPISGSSTETDLAMDLLNEAGARILPEHALAIPEGRLSTEIRWAIRALGMQDLELVLIPTKEAAC
jgi:hypothetical protein